MFNSPYAKSGNFQGGANSGNMNPFGPAQNSGQAPMTGNPESPYTKPVYASGGGLNQNPGGMQQQGGWNPNGFNGFIGAGSNAPYSGPIGGGFQQQQQEQLTPTVNPGQPGDAGTQAPAVNAPNRGPSMPPMPLMPQFRGTDPRQANWNVNDPRRSAWFNANRPNPFGAPRSPYTGAPNTPPNNDPYQSPPIIPPQDY